MAQGNYFFSTKYSYNCFGADEHLNVILWQLTTQGYKRINTWSYSTFIAKAIANRRAESRIMRLRNVYGAQPRPE
jgi:hypothetical protein